MSNTHEEHSDENNSSRKVLLHQKMLMTLLMAIASMRLHKGGALFDTRQAGLGDPNYGVIYLASMWRTSKLRP